jgi:hypothetical protein
MGSVHLCCLMDYQWRCLRSGETAYGQATERAANEIEPDKATRPTKFPWLIQGVGNLVRWSFP